MPKTKEELEAEQAAEKQQSDFLTEAAEVDDTTDFDKDMENSNAEADGKTPPVASGDEPDGTQISDADIASVEDGEQPKQPVVPEPTKVDETVPIAPPAAPPAEPPVQPTPPPIAAQAPAPQAPSSTEQILVDATSNDEIQRVYGEWRSTTEDLLADHHYKLKQEDLEALELEPAKVLPRMMAKVYLDSVTAAMSQITMHLPRLVRIVNEQTQSLQQSENTFFDRWPELKTAQGGVDTVIRLGQNYRNANPQATEADFINEVGAAAMVALRLDPNKKSGNGQAAPVARPASFVPATQTPQGGIPKVQPSTNVFDNLDREFTEIEDIDI